MRSLEIEIADGLNISLGMAKVLTICILPIRDRSRHFHKLIVFLIDSLQENYVGIGIYKPTKNSFPLFKSANPTNI